MSIISVDDYIEEGMASQLVSHIQKIGAGLLTFLERLFNKSEEKEEQAFFAHKVSEVQKALKWVEKHEHPARRAVGCRKIVALELAFQEIFGEQSTA